MFRERLGDMQREWIDPLRIGDAAIAMMITAARTATAASARQRLAIMPVSDDSSQVSLSTCLSIAQAARGCHRRVIVT